MTSIAEMAIIIITTYLIINTLILTILFGKEDRNRIPLHRIILILLSPLLTYIGLKLAFTLWKNARQTYQTKKKIKALLDKFPECKELQDIWNEVKDY